MTRRLLSRATRRLSAPAPAPTLLCSLLLMAACSSSPPAAHDERKTAAPPSTPTAKPEQGEPTPAAEAKSPAPGEPAQPERPAPETAALQADFELLCAALNHDYVDGTLTDYYKDARPKTAIGEALRREGNESTQPGRALAAGYREHLSARAETPGPDMPECRRLFEELDDLE